MKRHDELDLVMEFLREHRERNGSRMGDRIGWFHEEEWRLGFRVASHFHSVIGVVPPNADHATHRKVANVRVALVDNR